MYILSRTLFILYAKLLYIFGACFSYVPNKRKGLFNIHGRWGGCEHVEGDIYFWHNKFIKGPDFLGVLDNFFQ